MPKHTLAERTKNFFTRSDIDRRLKQRRKETDTEKGRAVEAAETENQASQRPVTVTISVADQLFGKN